MEERKEKQPEVVAAAVVGFLGGVAVGRYLLDEILGEEELKELKKEGRSIVYRCPKCNQELSVGQNFCPSCGVALEWHKKRGLNP
ncbi:MAG: zinc ribbon domain-containing protein [Thermoplasmata archaeon]|nr:MAG: zinc ribbon domain-containing protein [Thermoplasmata archaeon]